MKKGKIRVIVGIICIILQVMSILGNPAALSNIGYAPVSYFLGFFFVGILGVILLISGLSAGKK